MPRIIVTGIHQESVRSILALTAWKTATGFWSSKRPGPDPGNAPVPPGSRPHASSIAATRPDCAAVTSSS